jgi:Na+/proline symporter
MIGVTEIMRRRGNVENAEEFTVAKRSLGTGLTAAGVTSSWTWSTTLLSSATVAYEYGVAGSFFYAACNSTQIMIFSNLAIVRLAVKAIDWWQWLMRYRNLSARHPMPVPFWK